MKTRFTEPSVLVERSDIDPHQRITQDMLGEHLGDGFFLNYEPVRIIRDPRTGRIVRTESLAEFQSKVERRREALRPDQIEVADPVDVPKLKTTSQREQLVAILATRMFQYFEQQLIDQPQRPNPIRDGIPVYKDGSWILELDPAKTSQVSRVQAPPGMVYEWIKAMLGARAQLVNKKRGWKGVDLGLLDKKLEITRAIPKQ
jgi:hypothetical protein